MASSASSVSNRSEETVWTRASSPRDNETPPPSPILSDLDDDDEDSPPAWLSTFPLDEEDTYRTWPVDRRGWPGWTTSDHQLKNDPRIRVFNSLFDISLLDRKAPNLGRGTDYATLRWKWKTRFQRNQNGRWDYVQYVPPWTDPDWDERYVYLGENAAPWPADHPLAKRYAMPGWLQTQRPALRDTDRYLNPTDAAKRWGIYPFQTGQVPNGSSGVTPTQPGFPTVALEIPRWSASTNNFKRTVTIDDLKTERSLYDMGCQSQGTRPSDEGFRSYLEDAATKNVPRGDANWDLADKLLQLHDLVAEKERREQYQSFIFSGSTTNELVQQGSWTMGRNATADIAEPLHDLITRDKWANTEERGVREEEPRFVYDISGKRGEVTARRSSLRKHNDEVWRAIQPALQIVSKVLASDHPVTWAWADLRKASPVRDELRKMRVSDSQLDINDETRAQGVYRHDFFEINPDFSGREEDLDDYTRKWDCVRQLVKSGFDTTKYVCAILKHTIQWDILPMFHMMYDQSPEDPFYGSCRIEGDDAPSAKRPFKITISIAADLVWQLLVDEYSTAEKAAVSFTLANTMLHELAHAANCARLQMCAPLQDDGTNPKWLLLDPTWQGEIRAFGDAHGVDILQALRTHGLRNRVRREHLARGLMVQMHETLLWDEQKFEEGAATENQYFGGVTVSIHRPRFLAEVSTLLGLEFWHTGSEVPVRSRLRPRQDLPAETYLKLFRKDFWEVHFRAYGHEALKLVTGQPLPGIMSLSRFTWRLARMRFGSSAAEWMQKAYERLGDENDNQMLWLWLYYKTKLAVEHLEVHRTWWSMSRKWQAIDRAIWVQVTGLQRRYGVMRAKLVESVRFGGGPDVVAQNLVRRVLADPKNNPDPLSVLKGFRKFYASLREAVRDLSREAVFNQNMAAAYAGLEDNATKAIIYQVYGGKFRARMNSIYINAVDKVLDLLGSWDDFNDLIKALLTATDGVREILGEGRDDLRAKLNAIRTGFTAVVDLFSDVEAERMRGLDSMNAVPKSALKPAARRIQRMARLQYSRLRAGSSLKNVADDWMLILRSGSSLGDPPSGSYGEAFNKALFDLNRSLDSTVTAQQQAAEAAYPDSQEGVQEQVSHLAGQQPGPEEMNQVRNFNPQLQQQYASATGFYPSVDPQTGLNRFAPFAGRAITGQPQPGNAMLFGASAVQTSCHLQQVEATIAQGSSGGQVVEPDAMDVDDPAAPMGP